MGLIFISHSSRDERAAAALRDRLLQEGYSAEGSIFLDSDSGDGIKAGQDWEQTLYRSIRASRAVIVLCSKSSMESRWCFMEITHARALGKHLFPVRIDDCSIDGILSDHQVVDLSREPEDAYRRLFAGLADAGLDPSNVFLWDGKRPPYPGLMAFEEADAAMFFGREDEIADGLDLLNRTKRLGGTAFVTVLGASGSGKSSFVRAGLIPRLRRDSARWLIVGPFRPRNDPFPELVESVCLSYERVGARRSHASVIESLQAAIEGATTADNIAVPLIANADDRDRLSGDLQRLEESLPAGSDLDNVRRHLRLARLSLLHPDAGPVPARLRGGNPLLAVMDDLRRASRRELVTPLLVIDQFEELLDRPPDHPAARFLGVLCSAMQSPDSSLLVLATMRSDFLGRFQNSPELTGLGYETFQLGPLRNLTPVIAEPARSAGLELEPGLSEALIRDAKTEDALPLLAFTLRELYDKGGQQNRLVAVADYQQLGGLEGAVAKTADELVARLDEHERELLRGALVRMARISDEGNYVRRTASWKEFEPRVHRILERFIEARLLTAGERSGDRILEVAHEALFRSWSTLKGWLDESAEALRISRDVAVVATDWEKSHRAPEYLWRGARLARAIELASLNSLQIDTLCREFLDASVDVEQSERRKEEARRKRQLRIASYVAAAIGGLLIVAVWLYWDATAQRNQAIGRQLASSSALVWSSSRNGTLAALLGIESLRRTNAAEGFEALWRVNRSMAREVSWLDHDQRVAAVAFSPDGSLVATGSDDRTAHVFEARTGRELARKKFDAEVHAVTFSPDGRMVAVVADGAYVFEAATGQEVTRSKHRSFSLTEPPVAVAFSADGRLVTAMAQDRISVIQARQGSDDASDLRIEENRSAIALSPGGTLLMTMTRGGLVTDLTVLDTRSGRTVATLAGTRDILSVRPQFSRDSSLVAIAIERAVLVFRTHSGDRIAQFHYQEPVRDLAISPGGSRIAAALGDNTVHIAGTQTGHEYSPVPLQERVTAMAIAPDDTLVAIASSDSAASAFDSSTGREISRFENQRGINEIAFSPDGSLVAVASGLTGGDVPGGAGVFEPRTGREVARLRHEADVSHVTFTPDGNLTATVSGQTIRLFDTREAKEAGRIDRLLRDKLTAATLAISADGNLLAVGAEMRAKTVAFVFESRSGRELVRLEDAADTEAVRFNEYVVPFRVAFSPDASMLAVTSHHKAMVIDPRTGRELTRLDVGGDGYAVAFSSDGKSVVVGSRGRTQVFDARTGRRTAELEHPSAEAHAVALSADGRRVAVALGLYETFVFATASGREIARLWQQDERTGLTINADGTLVATASESKRKDEPASAHVFDVGTGREVARMTFPEPVKFMAFVDNRRRLRLATGKTELSITQELVLGSDLIAEACSKVHRNLTESEWENYVRSGSRAKTCPQLTR